MWAKERKGEGERERESATRREELFPCRPIDGSIPTETESVGGVGKFSASRADKTLKVRTFSLHLFKFPSTFPLFESKKAHLV